MVMAPRPHDSLVVAVREHANAGEWERVRAALEAHAVEAASRPELALLLGESQMRLGRFRDARVWLTGVLARVTLSGDHATLRRMMNLYGAALFELGELDAAAAAFESALTLGRHDEDDLLVARATNNLAMIANVRGNPERAIALYQIAVASYQRLGNATGLAESYHNLAISYRDAGQSDRAEEYERRAIDYAGQVHNTRLAAIARLGRAELLLRSGDALLAGGNARLAAREFARLSDPIREADALRVSGLAALAEGNLAVAARAIEQAVGLARRHGGTLAEAEALRARAELSRAAGDHAAARADARGALALYEALQALPDRDAVSRWIDELDLDR